MIIAPIICTATVREINTESQVITTDKKVLSGLEDDIVISDKDQPLENLTVECFSIVHSFHRTLGNFRGDDMPEVASIAYIDGRIHFYDLVNRVTYAINNDTAGPQAYNGLTIARGNFDADSWDEVITVNITGIVTIIDGDGTTIKRIDLNIAKDILDVLFFEVVDLDLDGHSDTVMLLRTENLERIFTIINGTTGTISVNLTLTDAIDVTIGNFAANDGMEITIAYSNNTVAIYNYMFQHLLNRTISSVYIIETISNASWHYDALLALLLTTPKNVTIYNATTLTPLGYSAEIDFHWNVKPKTADLDDDGTTEAIIPTANGFGIFDLNTNNITKTAVLFLNAPTYIITSRITRDQTYDFVIGNDEVLFMFKGVKDDIAKPRILRKISEPSSIQTCEVWQYDTGLPDLFVLTDLIEFSLYVYRSDSSPPRLSELRIYPIRPTVDDSYVSISARILDESTFDNPILIYNITTVDGTLLGQGEALMVSESYMSDTYLVYLSNLKAGTYTFKIIVTDSYDNTAIYDNNGSLYTFNVYSKRLFKTKLQTVALTIPSITSDHPMDLGKLDGDQYDDVVIGVSDHAEIIWGNHSVTILDVWADVNDVEVYVANLLAGSNDDILIYYYNATSSRYQINIYDGTSLEISRRYTFGSEIQNFAFGDVDGDGYEDLVFSLDVNTTHDKLIVINTLNNVTLLEKEAVNILYIGVFDLTEDQYMDVIAVSLDSSTNTLNLTAYAGEQNLNMIYYFNKTFSDYVYDVMLYVDNFITTEYLQVALVTSLSGYDKVFLLNASNGHYLKKIEIPYTRGLTPVDYGFDGIKEISFILYDNSLVIVSLLNESFHFRKDSLLPEEPIAVFWDRFDEDQYEDLIYVLSDEIAMYSLAEDRFEVVQYPFRMIHSVSIGEFFELPSKDVCFLTRDLLFEKYININMFYRPNITVSFANTTVLQGKSTEVTVEIRNVFGDPVTESSIVGILKQNGVILRASSFISHGNGTYTLSVAATNIPAGYYGFSVVIVDDYYGTFTFDENLKVIGNINLEVTLSSDYIEQESEIKIRVVAFDDLDYPVRNANVTIVLANKTYNAVNVRGNVYVASINVGKLPHGEYLLTIEASGPYYITAVAEEAIYIYPKIPELHLSFQTLTSLLGISMGISFVGLSLYYGISSKLTRSISVDERQRLLMSFKPLDLTYFALALLLFGTLGTAGYLYMKEFYELAVAVLGLALMELLLVYGIWLYRDAAYTLVTEKMSIKRTVLSLWHIVLAPMIILGIFEWGANIEWFAYYLLGETINLGVIELPSLYVSLLGTYTTSIIVLVANIYLNSRRWKNRFSEMRVGGTPEKVINEEKIIQLGKMSSSIRIKFFGFLVILGASLVSTTPLLQYYQLGVVVVLPLIFIVVIPYIVSKILGALGFTKKIVEKKMETPQT